MNEALQGKLSEILELGKQGVLQAVDIIKEQMPDLVKQILKWEFAISLLWFTLFFIISILLIIFTIKLFKKHWEKACSEGCGDIIIIGSLVLNAVPIIIACSNLVWLKILIAPKLFLVEYISKFIK